MCNYKEVTESMSLNTYRDEVKDFLEKMDSLNGNNEQKIQWLDEEFQLLRKAVCKEDNYKIKHQIYDMIFLLFEIAADNDYDIDEEWNAGRERKQKKYLSNA